MGDLLGGTWTYVALGGAVVLPQASAYVLRRRDSRLAGPVALVTSIILRLFVAVVFLTVGVNLATRHRTALVGFGALIGAVGIWTLTLTVGFGWAAVRAAGATTSDDFDVPPWLVRVTRVGQAVTIAMLGGGVAIVLIAVASHWR